METNNIDKEAFEYLKGTNACKYIKKETAIRNLLAIIVSFLLVLSGIVTIYQNRNKLDFKSFALLTLFVVVPLIILIISMHTIINLIKVKYPIYVKFANIETVRARGTNKLYMGTNRYKRVIGETIEFYVTCKEDDGKIH